MPKATLWIQVALCLRFLEGERQGQAQGQGEQSQASAWAQHIHGKPGLCWRSLVRDAVVILVSGTAFWLDGDMGSGSMKEFYDSNHEFAVPTRRCGQCILVATRYEQLKPGSLAEVQICKQCSRDGPASHGENAAAIARMPGQQACNTCSTACRGQLGSRRNLQAQIPCAQIASLGRSSAARTAIFSQESVWHCPSANPILTS